jgi:hypothetical protein
MSNDASILSWSGPDVDDIAYGYVGVLKGYCAASVGGPVTDVLAIGSPCTVSKASSMDLPKRKGLKAVVCSRARMEVFRAIASCAESVSDFAITGMTLVRDDKRCMYSMSVVMSLSV